MQPARKGQGAVADGGAGQGLGDFGLDAFFAARTVAGVNLMLGDRRPRLLDVFDDARAGILGWRERPVAIRTAFEPVFLAGVDVGRRWAAGAWMSFFTPRFFAPAFGRRLFVGGDHGRRRGGIWFRVRLLSGQRAEFEQRPDHRFLPLSV